RGGALRRAVSAPRACPRTSNVGCGVFGLRAWSLGPAAEAKRQDEGGQGQPIAICHKSSFLSEIIYTPRAARRYCLLQNVRVATIACDLMKLVWRGVYDRLNRRGNCVM